MWVHKIVWPRREVWCIFFFALILFVRAFDDDVLLNEECLYEHTHRHTWRTHATEGSLNLCALDAGESSVLPLNLAQMRWMKDEYLLFFRETLGFRFDFIWQTLKKYMQLMLARIFVLKSFAWLASIKK